MSTHGTTQITEQDQAEVARSFGQSDDIAERILSVADFVGWQPDADGRGHFQLWNLRKPLGGHPKGSTLARQTLVALLLANKI